MNSGGPGRWAGYGERAAHHAVRNYSLMVLSLYIGSAAFVNSEIARQPVFSTVMPVMVIGVSSSVCTAVRQ